MTTTKSWAHNAVDEKMVNKIDEVLECYHVAGDEDFIMKVVVADINEYRDFVVNKLTNIPGINKIKQASLTFLVLEKTQNQFGKKPEMDQDFVNWVECSLQRLLNVI